MKLDLVINFAFSFLKALVNMFVVSLSSSALPMASFQLIMYARRIAPLIGGFLQLGFSQAVVIRLPRDLSKERWWYNIASGYILFSFVMSAILIPFLKQAGDIAVIISSFNIALDYIIRSLLLSKLRFLYSNVLELLSIGGLVIIVIYLGVKDAHWILIFSSVTNIILLLYVFITNYSKTVNPKLDSRWPKFEDLLGIARFGFPRSLVGVMDLALYAIPVAILGAENSLTLNLSSTFIRFSLAFISPVMEVINIKINSQIGKYGETTLDHKIRTALPIVVLFSFGVSGVIAVLAEPTLKLWLGRTFTPAILESTRILIMASPGMLILNISRGYIDSIFKKPFSAYILFVALCVCITVSFIYKQDYHVILYTISSIYFMIGFFCIAMVSRRDKFWDVAVYIVCYLLFIWSLLSGSAAALSIVLQILVCLVLSLTRRNRKSM